MEKIIIDRFEGDIAVCEKEDCSMVNINKQRLPEGVKAGNILLILNDGSITIDVDEECQRKEQILRMQQHIFGD